MPLLTALLAALPTIFLGAFLAAMVENVRERRRARRWAMRALRDYAARAHTSGREVLGEVDTALRQWLAAGSPEDMDGEAWRHTHMYSFSNPVDLTPFVRSEVATALPVEVYAAVRDLEESVAQVVGFEAVLNETFVRDVLPLWYERRVPLAGADARRVSEYRRTLETYRELGDQARRALDTFRDAMRMGSAG